MVFKKGNISWNKGILEKEYKKKLYHKKCPVCNKKFVHKDIRQKFCSRKCYLDLNIIPVKYKICKFCGKKFLENKKHRMIKFCSRGCAIKNNWKSGSYPKYIQKLMGRNGGIARIGKIRVERIKKICPICKKEFSHVPNYARQVDYCSVHCAAVERRKYRIFPKKDTTIEVKIQEHLSFLHLEYFTHKYISDITHGYQCDILIPKQETEGVIISQKTIIECDGCYFHFCSICNKNKEPTKKQLEQMERDKLRTQELLDKGYKVIRLWEHNIKPMELKEFQNMLL